MGLGAGVAVGDDVGVAPTEADCTVALTGAVAPVMAVAGEVLVAVGVLLAIDVVADVARPVTVGRDVGTWRGRGRCAAISARTLSARPSSPP